MGKLVIPKQIRLPFGYTITVKQLDDRSFDDTVGEVDYAYAHWNVNLKTIYLRKSQSTALKSYFLTHELIHAVLDWQHNTLQQVRLVPKE